MNRSFAALCSLLLLGSGCLTDFPALEKAAAGDASADAGTSPDAAADADAASDGAVPQSVTYVYVGSNVEALQNIDRFGLDPETGNLTPLGKTTAGGRARFMALHPSLNVLYVAGVPQAFELDKNTGNLTAIGSAWPTAPLPVHIASDKSGQHLLAAYWLDGFVEVVALNGDGTYGASTNTQTPGTNPHEVAFDPSGKFLFVPNVGSDTIAQFKYDATSGTLSENTPKEIAAPGGPRHLAFHPSGKFAYVVNEIGNTLRAYTFDSSAGTLSEVETESILPAGITMPSIGTELVVHPSGKFVYVASSAGTESTIAIFGIDQQTGALNLIGHESTRGEFPRSFDIEPSGRVLVVANHDSSTLESFLIDESSGKLTFVEEESTVEQAYYVGAFRFSLP